MRLALVVVCIASPAFAQNAVPGTGSDPLRELMILPAFTSTELPVLAMHGGNPEDTVLLFDGFELPWAFHDNDARSVVPLGAIEDMEIVPSAFGVEYGRASSVLAMTSTPIEYERHRFVELSVLDVSEHLTLDHLTVSGRLGSNYLLREVRPDASDKFADAMVHIDFRVPRHWYITISDADSRDGGSLTDIVRGFNRSVVAADYRFSGWHAHVAASYMFVEERDTTHHHIDTQAEVIRSVDEAAGLSEIELRLGQQTNSARYELATTFWRHDIAGWSSIAANLSPDLRATVGLRVDDFNGHTTTQPRASIVGKPSERWSLGLAGGAYRRPPNQLHEVEYDLGPERATHVSAGARYQDSKVGFNGVTYYIDRRRLVIRDQLGELHNTGFGTSMGVDLNATWREKRWFVGASMAITSSTRFDYLRAKERPSDYEQPFRLDLIGAYYRKNLILSARFQVASGLPFTPYQGALYNSDTDTYEPLYVPPLSERTPFHDQIDLRVDYRFRLGRRVVVDAFLDLHNAFRNRDAIGYRYSYDYSQRTAITALPLFPFAGLRAYL